MSEQYLNPLTDFGFKKLFGTEPNKDLLKDFLNTLLPEEHHVVTLEYGQHEHLGQTPVDRKAIYDLYCKNEQGEHFIVEIQKAKQNFFKDRSLYYASFPIQEQAPRGDWDFRLKAVYTIGVLDFIFAESRKDTVIHRVQLRNQHCEVFSKKLTFIYIELPKFTKTAVELESHTDRWLYLLRHLPDMEQPPEGFESEVFHKLFDVAALSAFNPQERKALKIDTWDSWS